MNDAAQIRHCNGALRANHSLFQPSPDAPRPNPRISNPESRSNREKARAGTPTSGIAGGRVRLVVSSGEGPSPTTAQSPSQPRGGKNAFAYPRLLFRVEKFPSFVLFGLPGNLPEPMFRVERVAKRRKIKGRPGTPVRRGQRKRQRQSGRHTAKPLGQSSCQRKKLLGQGRAVVARCGLESARKWLIMQRLQTLRTHGTRLASLTV